MNRSYRLFIPFSLLLLILISTAWFVRPIAAIDWQSKVDPSLLAMRSVESAEFLIILNEQADLSHIPDHWTKDQKGRAVYEALTAVADATQPALIAQLGQDGADTQSFWVTNMLLTNGDLSTIERMARRPDVGRIANNQAFYTNLPTPDDKTSERTANAIEWGLNKINAPAVWDMGYTGQGIIVAGQDTGYDWDHPSLKTAYRGWDGTTADHSYSWHDAIHSGGGVCGSDSAEPCDDHGHGTHTAGTMVGNDLAPTSASWPAGATNAVGVAPGAKWIGCRNMNVGWGTPTTYAECYQWFIAPTDVGGNNPDPSKAPHVINNSWGCPPSEGCTTPTMLQGVVQSVRAAGIINVNSAGNYGTGCYTVRDLASIYDEVFSVGSTTNIDGISSFSSRGPVTVDGSNRLKPDISAPGQGIRSTTNGGGYHSLNGTSMASPHVVGLVALILSAEPRLAGRVDLVEDIIRNSAEQLTSAQTCGSYAGSQIPNAVFGYGRIDAQRAISHALSIFSVDVSVKVGESDCATESFVTMSSPSTVMLCTTVQNSLYVTLTSQTITDSLGNVYTLSQTVAPGASFTFTRTLTITPAIIITTDWSALASPFDIPISQTANAVSVSTYRYYFPFFGLETDSAATSPP
ncbi:MAG: S8 family serine peptidase [Candidatus Promineifilaceae bacterium]